MTRITPDHLARGAFVYVRQSTSDQVLHNHESRGTASTGWLYRAFLWVGPLSR